MRNRFFLAVTLGMLPLIVGVIPMCANAACVNSPAGLVSWWGGDNNALDIIGTNNGAIHGGVTYGAGEVGRAFDFNGANGSYLQIPSSAALNIQGPLSISAWVYIRNTGGIRLIAGKAGGTQFYSADGILHFVIYSGGNTYHAVSTTALAGNSWHHVAGVFDGNAGVSRLYVDGALNNTSAPIPGQPDSNTNPYEIGGFSAYADNLDGLIDEVAVFNQALTGTDVQNIYNAGSAGICRPSAPLSSGLISWWKGENNANDQLGVNNATLQGGATYAAGKVGQAFSLNGANDYVLAGDSIPSSLQIQNEISLEAWIYATDNSTLQLIAGSQNDANHAGASIFLSPSGTDTYPFPDGHIHFQIGDGTSWHATSANAAVPLNQWVHIVATRKAGEDGKIYYNGVLQPSEGQAWPSGNIGYTGSWFAIGRQKDINDRFFKGFIDEVRIYNRAITANEIAAIYNAGGSGMTVPDTTPDAFNFTAKTGMPTSTSIVSNPITVTGINYPAAISITGGDYQINGGSWTSSAGTVNNGDTVTVRQPSSASYSTLTTATLTIGGVSGAFNVTTAASGDPDASGLISWWRAESNGFDSVGGNHGTLQGGTTYAPGRVGQAFNFDGADGYVSISNESNFDFDRSSQFSISAWVKTSAFSAGDVFSKYSPSLPYTGYQLVIPSGGNVHFYLINSWDTNVLGVKTSAAVNDGVFHYITVTYDGTSHPSGVRIYVDGVSQPLTVIYDSLTGSILNDISPTISKNLAGNYFTGLIDEVKVFNRVLSAKEVMKLANPNGPVSWWKGENNADDSIGDNDGTWQGAPAYGPGMSGNALVFNGVNNYVQIAPQPGSLDISTGHSFDLWIKLDGYPTTAAYILNKWVSSVEDKLLVVLPDGKVGYYLHNAFGGSGLVSSTKLEIGSWYHLAATYDGGVARLYINGNLDAAKNAPGAVIDSNGTLYLGFNPVRNASEPHDHLKGTVDEIKWYNRALSASEVANSYGLISWWKGEDNANDSVGFNSGTLQGGAGFADGRIGRAFSLDGVNSEVTAPAFNMGSDWTIAAWVNPQSCPDGLHFPIVTRSKGNTDGLVFAYLGPSHSWASEFGLVIGNGNGSTWQVAIHSGTTYPVNAWHQVVASKSGDTYSLYVDGALKAQQPVTGVSTSYQSRNVEIGHWLYGSNAYAAGLIDEVKIFGRALSATEIFQMAQNLADPFIFNPVANAPLSASIESNVVTVTGISSPAAISITGGEYSVSSDNGATWSSYSTTAPFTISHNDQVKVHLTSSDKYSDIKTATLAIGGVAGNFSVTTAPDLILGPVTSPTNLASQTIGGTVKSGAAVTVSLNSGTALPATVAGSNWSYTVTGLHRDGNQITVTATDTGYAPTKSATINCIAPQLTVTVTGTGDVNGMGGGTVTSTPAAIACTAGPCSALFDGLLPVTLIPAPDGDSVFSGWSGACTATSGNCDVTMGSDSSTGDRSAGATFAYVLPAQIQQTGVKYPRISDAYAALTGDGAILARQFLFTNSLNLDKPLALILKGGYDPGYAVNSGYSTIQGTLTVGKGSLTLEQVIIK